MIWADAGDDVIYGGEGNDTLRAGDGDDKSYGGAGNDIIYLSSGNDIEDGGDGNDTIKILSENSSIPITFDLLLGQYYYTAQLSSSLINLVSIENIESQASADTTVKDTPDANVIATGTGNDDIYSVGGDDIISTGAGDDAVTLTIGAYVVDMGSGDDTVILPLSEALINGGTGSDTVSVREIDGFESVYLNLENEFYFIESLGYAQDGLDKSLENFENVTITGSVNSTIIGTSGANTLTGSDGQDQISGRSGNDIINGGEANDTIDAEAGADSVTGGEGDDIFVQSLGDSIAATAQTIAATGTIAAGDTITFGSGIDIYTDFDSGNVQETIDTDNAGSTLATIIGQSELVLSNNVLTFASGNYVASTGIFTITADGVGADTLIIDVDTTNSAVSGVLSTSTSMFLLQGIDSDTLVAGDFI
jgi:Ca2+-binding RTX toxin-like protein